MDISVQHYGPDPNQSPAHAFRGPRPDHLPLTAAIFDASVSYGKESQAVAEKMCLAIQALETELIQLRGDA